MENELSIEYIKNAINELESLIGVKEPVLSDNIFSSIRYGKIKEAMILIALQLDLPIEITITNIPDYYDDRNNNRFHTTHLTKVDQHSSGNEGITAQVSIPGSLPFFGSPALNGYPINFKISDNCTEQPVVFAMIMAHELSHVLLYSLNHPQKSNEFYTDLTAIMLGFQKIFQNGRKITETNVDSNLMNNISITTTSSYGYLNDNQFSFAYNMVNLILENYRERKVELSEKLAQFKKFSLKWENTLYQFRIFLEFLIKNKNRDISSIDGKRITEFFQPGYMEELDLSLKDFKDRLETIQKKIKRFSHFTEQGIDHLSNLLNELNIYSDRLNMKMVDLRKDTKMLRKYVSIKLKIKSVFLSFV